MIIAIDKIKEEIKSLKSQGKKIIATNGCFDILHVGHLRYLEKSKAQGDILVVGLNSDASTKKLKGDSRPINTESHRAELLAALKPVDYVVIFNELDAANFLKEVEPDIYTKGADYKAEDLPEYSTCQEIGAKIVLIDLVEGQSSSNIIDQINT